MYWQDRMAQSQQALTSKGIAQTEKQLIKYYTKSMQTVIDDFEKTYLKLLEAVDKDKEPTPADLYKLSKYWELQAQLKIELQKLGDKQATLLSKQFESQYKSIYNSIALPDTDGYFHSIDKSTAQQMINQIWCADGQSWSNRIWTNTDKLQQALNDNLIDCVVTGKKTTDLKNILQKEFNTSYSRADSLVRTEMAHIQTQAAQQRYKDAGITEVEIWADKDERRCDVCGKLHEKKFNIYEAIPIPAHPRCRCTIIPVVEEKTVALFAKGSYNGYEPCFKDNVNFKTNKDVKKAIKQESTNFVKIYEPTNPMEFGEVLYGWHADRIKPINGYFDIKAHGLYDSIKLFDTPINAETLARILESRKDYLQGTPIRLLCCYTGKVKNGSCFAQDLANMLGVKVIAPDFELLVDSQGNLAKGRERSMVDENDFKKFKPKSI